VRNSPKNLRIAYRSNQQARRELFDIAATQCGYFTAKQAAAAGYGKRHIDYHVKSDNCERVERGLFRLPTGDRLMVAG